jgi:ribonuclease HI
MAWTYLLDHFDPAHPPPHVICLTDSQYAFVAITKGIKARTLTKLLRAIFRLKALLSKSLAELRIHWIPAHTGCRENDIADDLANLASRAAAAEPIFVTTPTVSSPRFNYILRNDYLHTHNQLH